MNTEDIQQALIQRCKTTAQARGLAPILPGIEADTQPRPAIGFDFSDPVREGGTLKGGEILRERGTFVFTIVVELGTGTAAAHGHADAIAALFPEGQRFAFTGGRMLIRQPPQILTGFPDAASWRVPVYVRYEAERA